MPVWFFVLIPICGFFAFRTVMRGVKDNRLDIAGQRVNRLTVIAAAIIIVVAFALLCVTQFGFIADHAP